MWDMKIAYKILVEYSEGKRHVVRIWDMKIACKILVEYSEGKRPLRRPRNGWVII
jgi:hypothetical protein